ncbi:unnamed protein product [Larinioides sclopetarius]|uniref:Uncharacterized protein n=1 Tax=Larinioides sclopetarius TaxID=280406 RepID=A0AAV1YXD2_9ARAC
MCGICEFLKNQLFFEVAQEGYQTVEGGGPVKGNVSNIGPSPPSFLEQVKKAKEENVGCCNFCMAFFGLLIGSSTVVWTIVLVIIVTVPIIMITVGSEYIHDCPVQKMIPISLIVSGSLALLSNIINFIDRFRRFSESGLPRKHTVIGWINVFLNLFLLSWFLATCYWVYSARVQFKSDDLDTYCHPHLYGFVYWLLNLIFIFFGTMVLISGLMMCCAFICW